MRLNKRISRSAGVLTVVAIVLCLYRLNAFAAESDAGEMINRFKMGNIPNSGSIVDESAVGCKVLGVMCQPSGVLKLEDGTFLVTDLYNKMIWHVSGSKAVNWAGMVTGPDGSGEPAGGYADGEAGQAMFSEPWAIVPFMDGYAVSDSSSNVIRYIENGKVRTAAGTNTPGMKDGNAGTLSVMFDHPTGLASDDRGNLFIADTNNNAVRRLDSTGTVITCTTELCEPTGLFWYKNELYIADSGNRRICRLSNLYTGESGDMRLTVIAGGGAGPDEETMYQDGIVSQARFMNPQGVTVSEDGSVFVADTGNGAVRKIKDGQVTTALKLDTPGMGTYPVSPRGLLAEQNILYITDPFSRIILEIPIL